MTWWLWLIVGWLYLSGIVGSFLPILDRIDRYMQEEFPYSYGPGDSVVAALIVIATFLWPLTLGWFAMGKLHEAMHRLARRG